jgi:hypothetical protein
MSKLIGLTFTAVLLLSSANPVHEKFAKYKAIEAYEIRPGVLMMPRYSSDGQVCEIGLEKLHYSPEVINIDLSLSREEIYQIVDELVPADERGPRSKDLLGTLTLVTGVSTTTTIDFENVSIEIDGATSPDAGKHKVTVDGVAAAIKWKNRKCQ